MKGNLINSLITKSNITVSMSYEQYLMYKNGECNLLDIKISEYAGSDNYFQYRKYRRYVTFGITLSMVLVLNTTKAYANNASLPALDELGRKLVTLIQISGYWICLAKGIMDIIKELIKGGDNSGGIMKVIVKYVVAFTSFFLLPSIFDVIRDTFNAQL